MGQSNTRPKLTEEEINHLKQMTSFSEAEIHDWWTEFLHSTKDNPTQRHLSEKEFINVYKSVFPGDVGEFARHVFRTFDYDQNGKVDFREFIVGMSMSGSLMPDKRLEWAFRVYDIDHSGYITRNEMLAIARSVYRMVQPVGQGDRGWTPESMVNDIFSELNSNDVMSWEDFRIAANRNPIIVNLLQVAPPDAEEDSSDDKTGEVFTT